MIPMDVVVRILNNQLSSLMWIDEKVRLFFHISIFLSLSSLNIVLTFFITVLIYIF
ncbi:hypothetical protein HanRHA438_Chr03g0127581 [Helianthus annuus]|nr:hypothetical protein HanRHA438_Chr03g0127581 [Helianthus annuus]